MTTQEQQQALADLYAKVATAHENAERLTQEIKELSRLVRRKTPADSEVFGVVTIFDNEAFGVSLGLIAAVEAAHSALGAAGCSLASATALTWQVDKIRGDNRLHWLDPVFMRVERQDVAPVVAEPCDNPACRLPACEDERDRLDQLGAVLTAEGSQRDLAEAWEGPR